MIHQEILDHFKRDTYLRRLNLEKKLKLLLSALKNIDSGDRYPHPEIRLVDMINEVKRELENLEVI